VEEVIRIDGEQSDTASHAEELDKHVGRVNAQLKRITKTTAALENSDKKHREMIAASLSLKEEKDKDATAVPATCMACEASLTRFKVLEDSVSRY
jgi:hypothetical protein